MESLLKGLNNEVALNDLGDASWFLGVRIQRDSPTGNVRLDQKQYIERSFQELNIKSKAVETPISVSYKEGLRKHTGKATANELYNYQRLVGKYNFSSCMTRCDTSYATFLMARFMCNPSPDHYQYLLRVPHYLSNYPDRGLLYEKDHRHKEKYGIYGLHFAVDASFADDFDTAKSTTGYVIFMAGSPIIWKSKLQTTVSTLTCEAEYAAVFEATKDCAWIRNFLTELDLMPEGPIPILEDNTGAIKWTKDDGMTSGRRHVRMEYHYAVEQVREGYTSIEKVASDENPADGFTKPLCSRMFSRFIRLLGLADE